MSKKERKLTPAEQKRKADFEKICEEMEQNGYRKKDLTVSVLLANVLALIVMLPFAAAVFCLYITVNSAEIETLSLREDIWIFIAALLLAVLHEAVHGLTWGFFAKNHFESIDFGIVWKALTPYCTCSEPLTKRQYMIGGAMPTLIVGFLPAIISAVIGNFWLFVLSEFMILGGGGDFLIILKMLFYRPETNDVLYYDHPYECGIVAFERK